MSRPIPMKPNATPICCDCGGPRALGARARCQPCQHKSQFNPHYHDDSIGKKFNRMTLLSAMRKNKKWLGVFKCDCGTIKTTNLNAVKAGDIQSCGCVAHELRKLWGTKQSKHGHATPGHHSQTYKSWVGMKQRCLNPNEPAFRNYGARGITLCERWMTFANFLADMGERPEGMSLDRIDNEGPYAPDNCRWATDIVQQRNKRTNKLILFNGEYVPMATVAEQCGMRYGLLQARITAQGWSVQDAISKQKPAHLITRQLPTGTE